MNIRPLTGNGSTPSLWDFLSVVLPGTITILVAVAGGRWLWRRRKDGARVALQEINEDTRRKIQKVKKESRPSVPSSLQYVPQNPQSFTPIRPQFSLQPRTISNKTLDLIGFRICSTGAIATTATRQFTSSRCWTSSHHDASTPARTTTLFVQPHVQHTRLLPLWSWK